MADSAVSEVRRIYDEIAHAARDYQRNLAPNEDLIFLFPLGQIHVEAFGIQGTALVFFGRDRTTGRKALVVQHYSQANLVMTSVPRPEGAPPARPIGFLND